MIQNYRMVNISTVLISFVNKLYIYCCKRLLIPTIMENNNINFPGDEYKQMQLFVLLEFIFSLYPFYPE